MLAFVDRQLAGGARSAADRRPRSVARPDRPARRRLVHRRFRDRHAGGGGAGRSLQPSAPHRFRARRLERRHGPHGHGNRHGVARRLALARGRGRGRAARDGARHGGRSRPLAAPRPRDRRLLRRSPDRLRPELRALGLDRPAAGLARLLPGARAPWAWPAALLVLRLQDPPRRDARAFQGRRRARPSVRLARTADGPAADGRRRAAGLRQRLVAARDHVARRRARLRVLAGRARLGGR